MKQIKWKGSTWANAVKEWGCRTGMTGKYHVSSCWWQSTKNRRKQTVGNRHVAAPLASLELLFANSFCLFIVPFLIIKDSDVNRIPAFFSTSCPQGGKTEGGSYSIRQPTHGNRWTFGRAEDAGSVGCLSSVAGASGVERAGPRARHPVTVVTARWVPTKNVWSLLLHTCIPPNM